MAKDNTVLDQIITMNEKNLPLKIIIAQMVKPFESKSSDPKSSESKSSEFRWGFTYSTFKELGLTFHQFDIYEKPRNVTNHFIEPIGDEKFTITGARNDRTGEYYDISVNGEPLNPGNCSVVDCASIMAGMEKIMAKHLHALNHLTFKRAWGYTIEDFTKFFDVYYNEKPIFRISRNDDKYYLDKHEITSPVHPYHIPVSPQSVVNLRDRRAR